MEELCSKLIYLPMISNLTITSFDKLDGSYAAILLCVVSSVVCDKYIWRLLWTMVNKMVKVVDHNPTISTDIGSGLVLCSSICTTMLASRSYRIPLES